MKTPKLDEQIMQLNMYERNNEISENGKEILNEFRAIKEQLASCNVSGRLLEITLKEWEHTCDDGCCYSYGEDIYLNGEELDEQNAEDSKNALTAVLTKLGYNVEINYR